jgi:hypothetical protein
MLEELISASTPRDGCCLSGADVQSFVEVMKALLTILQKK